MTRKIRPIRDRVLVRQDEPKTMIGSLHVPQGLEQWPPVGVVLAAGPRCKLEDFKIGDRVQFKRRPASAVVPDVREPHDPEWEGLVVLHEEDIQGVVE